VTDNCFVWRNNVVTDVVVKSEETRVAVFISSVTRSSDSRSFFLAVPSRSRDIRNLMNSSGEKQRRRMKLEKYTVKNKMLIITFFTRPIKSTLNFKFK